MITLCLAYVISGCGRVLWPAQPAPDDGQNHARLATGKDEKYDALSPV